MYDVTLHHCKNFDTATFRVEPKKLNIKYAPNGTGKSSVADGIQCAISGDQDSIESIKPFKDRGSRTSASFESEGLDDFKSIEVFNETYVNSVVFLQDSLFAPSFDVFVKTKEYEDTLRRIEKLLEDVRKCFEEDETKHLISVLDVLFISICGNSGLTGKNLLRATAPVKKGLSNGNLKVAIPDEFTSFSAYIMSERLSKWAKWHANGSEILDTDDDKCPFCGQDIASLKTLIGNIDQKYVSKDADNLDKVFAGVIETKDYLCDTTGNKLDEIMQSSEPLSSDQENYFIEVAVQVQIISKKLTKAKELASFFRLIDVGKNIPSEIADCKIDLSLLSHFDSEKTRSIVSRFNKALESTQKEAKVLLGVINREKDRLARSLNGYELEINSFFSDAGYPYYIKIGVAADNQCSVKLIHSSQYQVENASGVLSYGERNALALVFFMYSALSSNPDLVILDDPITSFDGHKRFAILHMLFLKDDDSPNTLKNRTVILLTHEYEVVFDIEHTLKSEFQPLAKTTLLSNSHGVIEETTIDAGDLKPVRSLFEELACNSDDVIVRIAYARKILEFDGNKNLAWEVLSSLVHHRKVPMFKDGTPLSKKEIKEATADIEAVIKQEFNYNELLRQICNLQAMKSAFDAKSCNYEKLQIARIALDGDGVDRVAKKLLDETLHVDNGFIYQLDPRHFEIVPDSIIEQCEAMLVSAAAAQGEVSTN